MVPFLAVQTMVATHNTTKSAPNVFDNKKKKKKKKKITHTYIHVNTYEINACENTEI
jgi:hypothetical protein